jgi:hypothetical protein
MNQPKKQLVSSFAVCLLAACFGGCSSSQTEDDGTASIVAQLTRADSCDDLLAKIQNDAIAKINLIAEQQRTISVEQRANYQNGYNGSDGLSTDVRAPSGPSNIAYSSESAGSAGGALDTGFSASKSNGSGGTTGAVNGGAAGAGAAVDGTSSSNEGTDTAADPSGHSDTNVQVKDVDEADIVKVGDDGKTIYLLHGNQFYVVNAWPAEEMSLGPNLVIEGQPLEMFVKDSRAVVYSQVYDNGELGSAGNTYNGGAKVAYDSYYYCGSGSTFTKISVIDLSGAKPTVVREIYEEGSYTSARLYDTMSRTVIQGGFKAPGLFQPSIEYADAWGQLYVQEEIDKQINAWRDRTIVSIKNKKLSDWLPVEKERVDGKIVSVDQRCRDFYAPSPGLADYGLTNIVMLDITKDSGPLSGAAILGSVTEVYSSVGTMLLAHQQWYYNGIIGADGQRTALHAFALTAEKTTYTASGFVPGYIVNQFSMDVDDEAGVIRLATTIDGLNEANWDRTTRYENRVYTLEANGNNLKTLGRSDQLGQQNEKIYSARFIGDKGYVVTAEQHDPLTVLDLSDPTKPTILGDIVIPGFSNYMHPLDAGHLLTIGRNTNASGTDIGLLLQIFDVSDPTKPAQTHKFEYAPDGYSQANDNHKAFTYWADKQLLAFPFTNYGGQYYDAKTGTYSWYTPKSTLDVFEVSIDNGFKQLGSVDHTALMNQSGCLVTNSYFDGVSTVQEYYWNCSQPEVQRGVFIDEYVYAISDSGITANKLSDLAKPVSQIGLLIPTYNGCYGYGYSEPGYTTGMGGISGGAVIGGTGGSSVDDTSFAGTGGMPSTEPSMAGIGGSVVGGAGGVTGTEQPPIAGTGGAIAPEEADAGVGVGIAGAGGS